MRTLEEIRRTPVGLLTEAEIAQLDPDFQAYARRYQEHRAKETARPGHEKVSTGTLNDIRRGWHPGHCKHCGTDMSYDSGD